MPATSNSIFKQIIQWLQQLLSPKKSKYQPQKILLEQSSSLTRLLLVERDTSRAVRTWRSIPKNGSYDILITCDHLQKVPGEKTIEKANPMATHRFSVVKISRIPGSNGTRKITPLWSADFIWVGSGTADANRYAVVITDAIAKQMLGVPDSEIDWAWEAKSYTKQYVGNTVVYPLTGTQVEPEATQIGSTRTQIQSGATRIQPKPVKGQPSGVTKLQAPAGQPKGSGSQATPGQPSAKSPSTEPSLSSGKPKTGQSTVTKIQTAQTTAKPQANPTRLQTPKTNLQAAKPKAS
ncbi:hypothetical protein BST81_15620 [Leptolyngbya sp. 'hensonii']|uniref:hypothetical protein n=1 Tax=Leptolyngbya sp. 'hensonii' TaxID=1922337 RepID=UPI00094FC1D6|nr:hypothetical protein [Leptolyngbya sp. 'hensonii']OLP17745.1 hypothetical protein BST81_15620 [Leptolyngbya sp. 'hensonii']